MTAEDALSSLEQAYFALNGALHALEEVTVPLAKAESTLAAKDAALKARNRIWQEDPTIALKAAYAIEWAKRNER